MIKIKTWCCGDVICEGPTIRTAIMNARHTGVSLRYANLRGVDLESMYLPGTDLRDTDLRGVNFTETDLSGSDLSGALVRRANFSDTVMDGVDVTGVDFSEAVTYGMNWNDPSDMSLMRSFLLE